MNKLMMAPLYISILLASFAWSEIDQANPPQVIYAKAKADSLWFPYSTRPSKARSLNNALYAPDTLKKVPSATVNKSLHVPWTFIGSPSKPDDLFALKDVIADRIIDPKTYKKYIKIYHGTTSDFLDVFKEGVKAIRFDVAATKVLGMGFYATASLNEAKAYACRRLKQRIEESGDTDEDLKAVIVVLGIEEDDNIKGKIAPKEKLSDDKTGEPIFDNIFFKRNAKFYNQFNFFSNIAQYLKIFKIIVLPNGFGRSKAVQDADGFSEEDAPSSSDKSYSCEI